MNYSLYKIKIILPINLEDNDRVSTWATEMILWLLSSDFKKSEQGPARVNPNMQVIFILGCIWLEWGQHSEA